MKEEARPKLFPDRHVPTSDVAQLRNAADPALEPDTSIEGGGPSQAQNTTSSTRPSLKRDQFRTDTSIKKLLQAKAQGVPIVLIVGRDYRWWPLQMRKMGELEEIVGQKDDGKARYAVLGWYMIRDAWEELEPEAVDAGPLDEDDDEYYEHPESLTRLFVRWKFAFEWIEAQGEPWWIKELRGRNTSMSPEEEDEPMKMEVDDKDILLNTLPLDSDSRPLSHLTPSFNPIVDVKSTEVAPMEVDVPMDTTTHTTVAQISEETSPLNGNGQVALFDSDLPSPVTSDSSQRPDIPASSTPTVSKTLKPERACDNCGLISPRIYFEGWFCANSACQYHSMVSRTGAGGYK